MRHIISIEKSNKFTQFSHMSQISRGIPYRERPYPHFSLFFRRHIPNHFSKYFPWFSYKKLKTKTKTKVCQNTWQLSEVRTTGGAPVTSYFTQKKKSVLKNCILSLRQISLFKAFYRDGLKSKSIYLSFHCFKMCCIQKRRQNHDRQVN